MMFIVTAMVPGTDHRVIVTTDGKGIIVRKKNPNPANPPQSITNPKKPPPPKAEMPNVMIMEIGITGVVTAKKDGPPMIVLNK